MLKNGWKQMYDLNKLYFLIIKFVQSELYVTDFLE